MAFFKFRKASEPSPSDAQTTEPVEVMRKRARHRLMGAVVLVLTAVVVFPLLVDKQPRPVAVDIPIEIPDKNKVRPLETEVAEAEKESQKTAPVAPETSIPSVPAVSAVPASPGATATAPAAKVEEVLTTPESKVKEAARAEALLAGKEPANKEPANRETTNKDAPANGERYIVQFGAYAENDKAQEARRKVESTGLKTYTHVIETKEGRRIRARVGPFASKAEAEQAADKIKKLDLPVSILKL
jgi:DedD protein